MSPVWAVPIETHIRGYCHLGTIQLHQTHHNKRKIALPDLFCTKERRIRPNGSRTSPNELGLSRSLVNARSWMFSCQNHLTSKKECSLTRFAGKSTKLAQTAPEQLQMCPVLAVRMWTSILGCFYVGTIQLHKTHYNKWKGALLDPLCTKEHWISPNGYRTVQN